MNNQDSFDATQRVYLNSDGRPKSDVRPRPPRPTPSQRAAKKKKQQRIVLISLCAAALILLTVLVVILISTLTGTGEDDGTILRNVYALNINLGGMTPEEAKAAIHEATDNTYTKLDMTVTVDLATSQDDSQGLSGNVLTLSPADTGAKLDVDALVDAAYALGRTGSRSEQQQAQKKAQTTGYTLSVLEYMTLDTEYIQAQVNALGAQFGTLLTQSSYSLSGERPSMTQETYDTTVEYQVLTVQIGTAEYGLSTSDLYDQILAAYERNVFEVTQVCSVTPPEELDCQAIYDAVGCIAPIDATCSSNWVITDEVYGYGFTLEALQAAVDNASYGDTVTVPLTFLAPTYTAAYFRGEVFQDTLSYLAVTVTGDDNWRNNLILACQAINGTTLNAGDEFSFNAIVGEPTTRAGYSSVGVYLGKSYQQVVGGGISQVASALYYCALKADLEILERSGHSYALDFIQIGFDADIYYGSTDLRFTNNTDAPIRILAEVVGNEVQITILGTDTKDYTLDLTFEIDEVYEPGTVTNTMSPDNAGGYVDGDVLREGITGYLVSTYVTRYDKATGKTLTQVIDGVATGDIPIAQTYYAKQDRVIVDIYTPPVVEPDDPIVEPDDPTDPTDPTDPDAPDDPVDPEDPDDPAAPEDPADPEEPVGSGDNGDTGDSDSDSTETE